ncbi:hypothetical protein [Synechococcus sp. UW140]|uniref:hypothetical protein n=1 Tax=unclassified Synechococcus TaxID=2626047 RepID=UPI000C8D3A14|nr:hypothetical protein [Synechococcus sp. UW140]MAS28976.1 hypothetical protein [Synechococcus sp. NAT40]
MSTPKHDRIQHLADSIKTGLDGGVDAIADKVKDAQLFADAKADQIERKNQALKVKLADVLRSAQAKGDDIHEGMQERLSQWVAQIDAQS